jgi:alcohol dehydrogenase class IV
MKNIHTFPNFLFDSTDSFLSFFKNHKKILLIHSNNLVRSKLFRLVKNKISKNINFYNISKNKMSINKSFYNKLNDKVKFDLVLSIGGGSSIDIGKIFYAKILNENFLYSKKIKTNTLLKKNKVDFAALVTLPGSGAEISKTSIININKQKKIFISRNFVPKYIAYDFDTISYNNPKKQMFRVIDSMVHGIESNETILSSVFSSYLSQNIVTKSKKILKEILKNKNSKFKISTVKEICATSFYGGLAQSECGSSLSHAIAHYIETIFGLNHSESIFLATFVKLNYEKKIKQKSQLFKCEKLLRYIYFDFLKNEERTQYDRIINKISLSHFLKTIKEDPCFKLTEKHIDINKLKYVMSSMKRKKKWNI